MRAVSHTLVLVFLLARHVDVAPARASRQNHRTGLKCSAVFHLHFDHLARRCGRNDLGCALQIHDVHAIVTHLRLKRCGKLRTVRFKHGNIVLDGHRVIDLTTEAFSRDTNANPLTRSVNRSRRTGRTAADDQHIKRIFRIELSGLALARLGIELGDNLFNRHASRTKHLTIEKHHWHSHDFTLCDLFLEGTAFNHHCFDFGIEDRHERQGLHHIRAVVAGQGHVDLKIEVAIQGLDRIEHVLLDFRRMATRPQQSQHQRGELMPKRQTGKTHTRRFTFTRHHKRRLALIVSGGIQADFIGQAHNRFKQIAHFNAGFALIQ